MRIVIGAFAVAAGLTGCGPNSGGIEPGLAQVNYAYSKAGNVGIYNPRGQSAGTFFVWNTETNRLQEISTVALRLASQSPAPGSVSASRLANIGIEGLPIGDASLVKSSVGAQISAKADNTVRYSYDLTKSALSDYVKQLKAAGETESGITDLFRPNDQRYRVVILQVETRAGKVEFQAKGAGENSAAAVFEVALPGKDIVKVRADLSNTASCGAVVGAAAEDRPICFSEWIVYDPLIRPEDGVLDWRRDDAYDQDRLSDAFRAL